MIIVPPFGDQNKLQQNSKTVPCTLYTGSVLFTNSSVKIFWYTDILVTVKTKIILYNKCDYQLQKKPFDKRELKKDKSFT